MTLTLHLKPELEAGLMAQAQANGMDLGIMCLRWLKKRSHPVFCSPIQRAGRVQKQCAACGSSETSIT
jgi:hypothetical protein